MAGQGTLNAFILVRIEGTEPGGCSQGVRRCVASAQARVQIPTPAPMFYALLAQQEERRIRKPQTGVRAAGGAPRV